MPKIFRLIYYLCASFHVMKAFEEIDNVQKLKSDLDMKTLPVMLKDVRDMLEAVKVIQQKIADFKDQLIELVISTARNRNKEVHYERYPVSTAFSIRTIPPRL